jgi:gluconolactonase
MRYLPEDGHVSVLRNNANNSNGNTFDLQGRQISFEHATRRVVRYELDGKITVLADKFEGKPLNAPNDGAVHPDGSIWFTDPGYGSMMDYEGNKGELLLKEAVYRIDPSGEITKITEDLEKPNGLCFSPDYKKVYVADTGSPKNIRVYEVEGKKVKNGKVFAVMNEDANKTMPEVVRRIEELEKEFYPNTQPQSIPPRMLVTPRPTRSPEEEKKVLEERMKADLQRQIQRTEKNQEYDALRYKKQLWIDKNTPFLVSRTGGKGGSDGIRCDIEGNLWASAGWVGAGYDGVHVFNPESKRIGQIKLPETVSNLCFGGPKRNRLFITASQSLYSLYVNTRGAHHC